jgi:hypothetical protein
VASEPRCGAAVVGNVEHVERRWNRFRDHTHLAFSLNDPDADHILVLAAASHLHNLLRDRMLLAKVEGGFSTAPVNHAHVVVSLACFRSGYTIHES